MTDHDRAPRLAAEQMAAAVEGPNDSPAPSELAGFNEFMAKFIKLLGKNGLPWELINTYVAKILPGLSSSYSPDSNLSHFYDIGQVEDGVPNGEYRIDVGGKMIETRKSRIHGLVPEALEADLAFDWALGHEFGHGVQAAYGLLHEENREEGIFLGLPHHPRPEEDFLAANPSEACHPDQLTAVLMEKERQAEGFARLMLWQNLIDKGIAHEEAEAIITKIYDAWKAELPPDIEAISGYYYLIEKNHPAQEYGRSHPLNQNELQARFKK